MNEDKSFEKFKAYLSKIKDVKDDKCWLCAKTPSQIRNEFYEYMKHPQEEFEDLDFDDIVVMTYKLKKPICAACYFTIKKNHVLVKEILDKPEDKIWMG